MLDKSLKTKSDVIIYDLEDSVAPAQKEVARSNLFKFLHENKGSGEHIALSAILDIAI